MENAGFEDVFSYWVDSNGKLNMLIRPDMKYAPVKVVLKGDELKIDAFVHFTADKSQGFIDETIKGFKQWETVKDNSNSPRRQTEFDIGFSYGVKVKVNVHVYDENKKEYSDFTGDSTKQEHFDIELITENNRGSNCARKLLVLLHISTNNGFVNRSWQFPWNISNNRHTMYLDASDRDSDLVAAHELGHKLGVGEASSNGDFVPDSVAFKGKKYDTSSSIMGGATPFAAVTDFDVALMWHAFTTNRFIDPYKPES